MKAEIVYTSHSLGNLCPGLRADEIIENHYSEKERLAKLCSINPRFSMSSTDPIGGGFFGNTLYYEVPDEVLAKMRKPVCKYCGEEIQDCDLDDYGLGSNIEGKIRFRGSCPNPDCRKHWQYGEKYYVQEIKEAIEKYGY